MNHCNPDSSTKAHISSHTRHVFFNNSSLQKIHISSHPEHVFFHKGSHFLSPKHAFFKGFSTENSHIFPHKPCLLSKTLPQNSHRQSHTKHVFSTTLLYKKIMSFTCLRSQRFTYPLTKACLFFKGSSIEKSHVLSPNTCLVPCLLSMKQRQHV